MTLVERAKTWQFTGIQGDDQVKILVIQCKLQGVDSWKKGQRARRGIGAGGNTGFADVGQYMSKPESGADAIAIGMLMGNEGYVSGWLYESHCLLNKHRVQLAVQCVGSIARSYFITSTAVLAHFGE